MDMLSDTLAVARPSGDASVLRESDAAAGPRSRSRRKGRNRRRLVEVEADALKKKEAAVVVVGAPVAARSTRLDLTAFAQAGRKWLAQHATFVASLAVVLGAGLSLGLSLLSDRAAIDQLQGQVAQLQARLEASPATPGSTATLGALKARMDRLEKQVSSSAATGTIPPVAAHVLVPPPLVALPAHLQGPGAQGHVLPVPAASLAGTPARPAATAPTGWVLREIFDGSAVIEGRGGVRRVAVGDVVPGAGRIESIERRGGKWVLVAAGGTISGQAD